MKILMWVLCQPCNTPPCLCLCKLSLFVQVLDRLVLLDGAKDAALQALVREASQQQHMRAHEELMAAQVGAVSGIFYACAHAQRLAFRCFQQIKALLSHSYTAATLITRPGCISTAWLDHQCSTGAPGSSTSGPCASSTVGAACARCCCLWGVPSSRPVSRRFCCFTLCTCCGAPRRRATHQPGDACACALPATADGLLLGQCGPPSGDTLIC